MDNYEKQVYTGRKLFLKYDQDKLIEKYGLKHDEEYLYLKYIGTEYRIDRGMVPLNMLRMMNGRIAENIQLL